MKAFALTLIAVVCLVLTSCNGTSTVSPTVGSVANVVNPSGYVNGATTSDGAILHEAARVSTDSGGQVTFKLNPAPNTSVDKHLQCTVLSSAEVQVRPSAGVYVKWWNGSTICATSGGGGTSHSVTSNGTSVDWNDPVFEVSVGESEDVVKVQQGLVQVISESSPSPLVVGPGQQTIVPKGREPAPPSPIQMSDIEAKFFDQLAPIYPSPSLQPPSNTIDSEILSRIRDRQSIIVMVDQSAGLDEHEMQFIQVLVSKLAETWQVKPVFVERAIRITQPQVDVVITANPKDLPASVPLFEGDEGRIWSIAFSSDDTFRTTLEGFVRSSVVSGIYNESYLESFRRPPSYQPLASFLFEQ